MAIVALLLALLSLLLGFLDFLLGPKTKRRLNDSLVTFYVAVEGSWEELYKSPARFIHNMLRWMFSIGKVPTFIGLIISSMIINIVAAIYHGAMSIDPFVWRPYAFTFLLFQFIPTVIADSISWAASLILLQQVQRSRPAMALVSVLAMVCVALLCASALAIYSGFLAGTLSGYGGLTMISRPLVLVQGMFLQALQEVSGGAWGRSGPDTLNLFGILPFITGLPLILFSIVTALGLAISLTRRATKPFLSALLARIDESGYGVLKVMCIATGSLGALATAWASLEAGAN